MNQKQTDFLVIGSGIAGLSSALLLSELGKVTVVTKGKLKEANTYWAQGGIAAVMDEVDSFSSHIEDTVKAGGNYNDEAAVKHMVENGPKAIRWLQSLGVKFQDNPVLEAGHKIPRVWRTSDFTGMDVLNVLIKKVKKNKGITVLEESEVIELVVHEKLCKGAFVKTKNEIEPLFAKNTVLATGGLGALFEKTTNTLGSAGDGVALAVKAGLEPLDLEFVQFHPTAYAVPDDTRYFLLSEVLRGFGAKVVNEDEEEFLNEYDTRGELAPRDVLTRAIHFASQEGPVYMTLKHLDKKETLKTFPNIAKRLKKYKLDLTSDLIPVAPVAHYSCGGVPTDLKGATKLPGLFAVGEVARTGVHGANRLASNSLLEAVVFSHAIKGALEKNPGLDKNVKYPEDIEVPSAITEDIKLVKTYSQRIKKIMWDQVGIIRTKNTLLEAKKAIESIPARDYRIQNRQIVCYKMIEAALERSESLGCHYISSEL